MASITIKYYRSPSQISMSAAVAGSEEIVSLDYDTIELLDHANGDEAIVPKSGRVGSLSREERGSWYFIGHGVVECSGDGPPNVPRLDVWRILQSRIVPDRCLSRCCYLSQTQ